MSIANELIKVLNEAKVNQLEVNLQEVSDGIKVTISGDYAGVTERVCDSLEEVVSCIKKDIYAYGII
ncbi:hypothetical protein SP18gp134 [Shigella phage SP18]|uniref:Uncharacterized protein n=1 Tax=Shigella phage SP18 TaxID=645664 RepID=E3SFM3_BPSP8|nr:hypothetical protein SP18_gp134 [Shigella phage SP18]ADO19476.1 hypothetical protein SP18gp134 [Shigella phage SP18]